MTLTRDLNARGAPPAPLPLRPTRDRASFRSPARLKWIGDSLHLDGKRNPVVTIERDTKHDVMWRVRLSSGELSGMLNRTRCKDAALAFACRVLGEAAPP
jgi:hypothetical protein